MLEMGDVLVDSNLYSGDRVIDHREDFSKVSLVDRIRYLYKVSRVEATKAIFAQLQLG